MRRLKPRGARSPIRDLAERIVDLAERQDGPVKMTFLMIIHQLITEGENCLEAREAARRARPERSWRD